MEYLSPGRDDGFVTFWSLSLDAPSDNPAAALFEDQRHEDLSVMLIEVELCGSAG